MVDKIALSSGWVVILSTTFTFVFACLVLIGLVLADPQLIRSSIFVPYALYSIPTIVGPIASIFVFRTHLGKRPTTKLTALRELVPCFVLISLLLLLLVLGSDQTWGEVHPIARIATLYLFSLVTSVSVFVVGAIWSQRES